MSGYCQAAGSNSTIPASTSAGLPGSLRRRPVACKAVNSFTRSPRSVDQTLLNLLRAMPLGDVTDDPDDRSLSLSVEQTDANFHWKFSAVRPSGGEVSGDRPRRGAWPYVLVSRDGPRGIAPG